MHHDKQYTILLAFHYMLTNHYFHYHIYLKHLIHILSIQLEDYKVFHLYFLRGPNLLLNYFLIH